MTIYDWVKEKIAEAIKEHENKDKADLIDIKKELNLCSHLGLVDGSYLCNNPEELTPTNCKDDKCPAKIDKKFKTKHCLYVVMGCFHVRERDDIIAELNRELKLSKINPEEEPKIPFELYGEDNIPLVGPHRRLVKLKDYKVLESKIEEYRGDIAAKVKIISSNQLETEKVIAELEEDLMIANKKLMHR